MPLKNRVRLGTSIDIQLQKKLHELSKTTRIPISKLIDEAIKDLVEKHQKNE